MKLDEKSEKGRLLQLVGPEDAPKRGSPLYNPRSFVEHYLEINNIEVNERGELKNSQSKDNMAVLTPCT